MWRFEVHVARDREVRVGRLAQPTSFWLEFECRSERCCPTSMPATDGIRRIVDACARGDRETAVAG
jgi:hypothetical protein